MTARSALRLPSLSRPLLLVAGSAGLLLLLGAGAIIGGYGRAQPAPVATAPPVATPAVTPIAQPSVATATPAPPISTPTPLVAGPGIFGTVLNGPIGRPLTSAVVVAYAGGTTGRRIVVATATTDASGSYGISLPAGTYRVNFRPPRNAGLGSHWWHAAPGQIALTFERASDVTVSDVVRGIDAALLPGYSITGRVTDAAGAGIKDALAFAISETAGYVVGGTTDATGTYSLSVGKTSGAYRIGFKRGTDAGSGAEQWWDGVAEQRYATPIAIDASGNVYVAGTRVVVRDGTVSGINARLGP